MHDTQFFPRGPSPPQENHVTVRVVETAVEITVSYLNRKGDTDSIGWQRSGGVERIKARSGRLKEGCVICDFKRKPAGIDQHRHLYRQNNGNSYFFGFSRTNSLTAFSVPIRLLVLVLENGEAGAPSCHRLPPI